MENLNVCLLFQKDILSKSRWAFSQAISFNKICLNNIRKFLFLGKVPLQFKLIPHKYSPEANV